MGIVSGGGGGGTFNGGTITEGLAIADPDGAEDQLTITGTGTGTANLINATAVHTTFTVDSDGTIEFSGDDGPNLYIDGIGTHAGLGVSSDLTDKTGVFLSTYSGILVAPLGTSAGGVAVRNASNAVVFKATGTVFMTALHAAPADGALAAGDCALWFDQTNAAGKLMVKAKTADGTVVAGSLALA